MNGRLIGILGSVALVGVPLAVQAQVTAPATVKQVIRVVKAQRGNATTLEDAKPGTTLNPGDRVRTAGRSAAGLRFADQSTLRLGELTEVVITDPRKRSLQVLRGNVLADYKAPGVISGGQAVAAVRGTHVQFVVDPSGKNAEVRCYKGRVFVSSSDNPIVAGAVTTVTATSLVDQNLVNNTTDFNNGEIRFTDGPFVGQVRRVTRFDPRTGTVTFAPALPANPGGGQTVNGYLLVQKPGRSIVDLKDNMGTLVNLGRDPQSAHKVPGSKFAMLNQRPVFKALDEGAPSQTVFPGSETHQTVQETQVAERQAVAVATRSGVATGPGGERICDVFTSTRTPLSARVNAAAGASTAAFPTRTLGMPAWPALPIVAAASPAAAPEASTDAAANAAFAAIGAVQQRDPQRQEPPTLEQRYLPSNVAVPVSNDISSKVAFRIEPFAITGNDADVLGGRIRMQASSGDAYLELGYRYASINERADQELSEGFLVLRGKYGDFTMGRQHLFLRLANNTNIGTLMGLETSDAFVWQLPLKKGYKQSFGYIWDTQPVRSAIVVGSGGGSFHAGFARGQAPLWRGTVGYSAMFPSEGGRQVGFSFDSAQSIIKNGLDIYGEVGKDTRGNALYTAGLYVPWLYNLSKVDLFIEWHKRESIDERWTVRARREVVNGLMLITFLDRRSNGDLSYGAGAMYSKAFK